jgi:hypothetical protein
MSLPGNYLDGRSHAGKAVMLQRDAHHLVFTDGVHTHRYLAHAVTFQAGASGLPDQLQLPDGGVIEVASAYRCQQLTGACRWLPACWSGCNRLALAAAALACCWSQARCGLAIVMACPGLPAKPLAAHQRLSSKPWPRQP